MANFPSSIPAYTGFTSTHTLSQDQHASQHNSEQADITAIATKVGTGASTPTQNTVLRGNGTGTTTYDQVHLATDVSGQLSATNLQAIYPVGCIYIETTGVNPNTIFGFGTWVVYGAGQTLIGVGTSDQTFNAGATGGESNHTLTSNEMPSHTHTVNDPGHTHTYSFNKNSGAIASGAVIGSNTPDQNTGSNTTGITNNNTGGGVAHNNLPPYIVTYFWKRTA